MGYAHVLNNQKIFANDGVRSKSSLSQEGGFCSKTITSFSTEMFSYDLDFIVCGSYFIYR